MWWLPNLESIFASDLDHSITSFANIFIHMEIHIEGNFDGIDPKSFQFLKHSHILIDTVLVMCSIC